MGFWRRAKFVALCAAVLCHGLVVTSPASAEVFDTITTPGDGWDVTFHPTNQNYAFFAHHRNSVFGCFYRLDPDGAGPIEQGDGCFNGSYTMGLGGQVGNKSSAWVTSDGNTAYIPLNYGNFGATPIAKVDVSDADPNNWSVTETVNWAAAMQYHSTSVMVDDVLYALSNSGWLTLDTVPTRQARLRSAATGRSSTRTSMKRTASFGPSHPTGTCIVSTRLMVRRVITTAGRTARAPISSQRERQSRSCC